MVAALANVAGHRSKYEILKAGLPPEDVGPEFVGGGDPIVTGYVELETIRRFRDPAGADIVDIGCGIGRLTQHLLYENIRSYLGTDIVPEILGEAQKIAPGDERFGFAIGVDCKIPKDDSSADIVVAFSVMTHLLDEEVFEYFVECHRVLRPGGIAILSFLDFFNPDHADRFFTHAMQHRLGHGDLLKVTSKDILRLFAERCGFAKVEFYDGTTPFEPSGKEAPLMKDRTPLTTIHLGQSQCVLTR